MAQVRTCNRSRLAAGVAPSSHTYSIRVAHIHIE